MIKLLELIDSSSEAEDLKNKAIQLFKRDKDKIGRSAAWTMLKYGGDNYINSHKDDIINLAIENIDDSPDEATKMYGQELVSTLLKLKTTR